MVSFVYFSSFLWTLVRDNTSNQFFPLSMMFSHAPTTFLIKNAYLTTLLLLYFTLLTIVMIKLTIFPLCERNIVLSKEKEQESFWRIFYCQNPTLTQLNSTQLNSTQSNSMLLGLRLDIVPTCYPHPHNTNFSATSRHARKLKFGMVT